MEQDEGVALLGGAVREAKSIAGFSMGAREELSEVRLPDVTVRIVPVLANSGQNIGAVEAGGPGTPELYQPQCFDQKR